MANTLTYIQKLNLMEYASIEQKALLGLLCCEAIFHLPTTQQATLCKTLLFDYVDGKEVDDAFTKAAKNCDKGITNCELEDTATVVNAAVCVNLWVVEATAIAIAYTKFGKSCSPEWTVAKTVAYEKLFLDNGPIAILIPDFENIPNLQKMLLNYPQAVELVRGLFNINYKSVETLNKIKTFMELPGVTLIV